MLQMWPEQPIAIHVYMYMHVVQHDTYNVHVHVRVKDGVFGCNLVLVTYTHTYYAMEHGHG